MNLSSLLSGGGGGYSYSSTHVEKNDVPYTGGDFKGGGTTTPTATGAGNRGAFINFAAEGATLNNDQSARGGGTASASDWLQTLMLLAGVIVLLFFAVKLFKGKKGK